MSIRFWRTPNGFSIESVGDFEFDSVVTLTDVDAVSILDAVTGRRIVAGMDYRRAVDEEGDPFASAVEFAFYVEEISSSRPDMVLSYSPDGRLMSVSTYSDQRTLEYDTEGNLTGVSSTSRPRIELDYDTEGRLVSVTKQES